MGKVDALDIRPHDLETIRSILQRHVPGHEVWAFGSRARWTARDYSDLDLAIRTDQPVPLKTMGALQEDLSESDLPMKVDVLDMASVSEKFRGMIEEEYAVVQGKGTGSFISFDKAVEINPKVQLKRGEIYPYVDMKQVMPELRSVRSSENKEFKGSGSQFQSGDTLMARITPCLENGKIAQFVSNNQPGHGSTEFIVIRGKDGFTDNDFAYYLTRWEKVRSFAISQMTGSSGRQRVPTDSLSKLEIPLPTLDEQKKIAHILGTLDDKIELNRRMNKTLEAMAQAIFQSWFVDFDPVHAKAEGRDTGLPPEVAALFPDGFQDSHLGPIPHGWKVAPLSELAELQTDMVQPYKSPENLWEHYSIPAYDDIHRPVIEPRVNIKSGKYLVPENAVLISKLNPQFPRVWLPGLSGAHRPVCSTEFLPFVPRHTDWRHYLYHLTLSPSFQTEIANRVTGTSGSHQRAKPSDISGISCPSPPAEMRVMFGTHAGSLSTRAQANLHQAHTLAFARDTLLPMLLSGSLPRHHSW